MKPISLLLVVTLGRVYAQEITLNELIENAKEPQRFEKILEEEQLSMDKKSLADTALAPLSLNHSLSRAKGLDRSGFEYEIGFSKQLKLGNTQALEREQSHLSSEASLLEERRKIIGFKNELRNLYHQYCLDLAYLSSFEEGYEQITTLYAKKERAYRLDEIAKTELLQLEFEQRALKVELDSIRQKIENEKAQMLSLSSVGDASFSCQDIYPLMSHVEVESQSFLLTQEAKDKRLESTHLGLKRYSKKLDMIEISTMYTKELDRNLYTIGVSIPLNFTSNRYENEKASLLHKSSAIELRNEEILAEKRYELKVLSERLSRVYEEVMAKRENINYYKSSILPLMKKSYLYGESSVMEYLLSRKKLYALEQTLLEQKKAYYGTLFKLYSIGEIEENNQ